ncbi:MAG: hypothetical protein R3190_14065 [Thermoanaerobaculia bacterium]|nr:hypothetical protein [Thermoanaerobaculia bacterium]
MRFTAAQVAAQMADRSRRFREANVSPDQLARTLTAGLRMLVEEVTDADEERLAEFQVVDNATVTAEDDYIDLTIGGLLEWLTINSIEWRASTQTDFCHEVSIGSADARNRLMQEFSFRREPIGYFNAGQNQLWKLEAAGGSGAGTTWANVYELRVHGVLIPEPIVGQSGMSVLLDFPRPLMEALTWWALGVLGSAFGATPQDLQRWDMQYAGEMVRLGVEARTARWAAEDPGHLSPDY